ncbi:hypothetical protein GCM10011391_07400 [Pullulanibacillus camelliae]|uniref:Uncharacterized protein n=1 Tax=Pullulanibacillus camelliae TaxID=1707096 RepID=A0A8J2VMF8_9BACL|nr:hypothetical protein GCM10011391_07400 [Pullulanibacillus camelliae]
MPKSSGLVHKVRDAFRKEARVTSRIDAPRCSEEADYEAYLAHAGPAKPPIAFIRFRGLF